MFKIKGSCANLKWLALSVVVIILDQWSKWLALSKLFPYRPVTIFPSFNLTLAFNEGAAFSFLGDASGWQRWLFVVIAILAAGGLTLWLYCLPKKQLGFAIGLALVIGGALGNLWDRLYYGYVIDFLDIYLNNWHWPAFNLADSAICMGVLLLLFCNK